MSAGVMDFLSNFDDIARPNRYTVTFNLPSGHQASGTGSNADSAAGAIRGINSMLNGRGGVDIKCHTMSLPIRSLMSWELKQNSAPFKIPYSASYDPVTFSFYASTHLDSRDFFEVWQESIVNVGTNTINFLDEYSSDIFIKVLNRKGEPTYGVKLLEAWPINVGLVDYSYGNVNSYQSITVTMAYKYWINDFSTAGEQATSGRKGNSFDVAL